ncbi:MAG: histidine kinase [Actinomycetota bacterium]|nr:histidine kinase [Actinomycetota bacterium]
MAQPSSVRPEVRLTVGRLRFDGDLETRFSEYYYRHTLLFARFALVLGIALYALFGILDIIIVPEVAPQIWTIRFVVLCLIVAVLGLTFTRWFEPIMQPVLSVLAMVLGLGIVAMIAIADDSDGHLYYAGLLLAVPFIYTLMQIRFAYAARAFAVIMVGYEVVAIWVKNTPPEILVNNNFFLLASVIVGTGAGYTIERGIRTDFLQRRIIEEQRAELAFRNLHLDSALKASLDEVRHQAEELQVSRARIVAAGDAERRRIERNLHDGAQQHLVGLSIKMRLAAELADEDAEAVKVFLGEMRQELQDAIQELRTLAHGIYPPLLMEGGLARALEAAAARSPRPVAVDAASLVRYPTEVEATTYFCCLEELQNASKHAGEGATVSIHVREDAGALVFEVSDDGVGFETNGKGLGGGFVNMSDLVWEPLGGACGWSRRLDGAPVWWGPCRYGLAPPESGRHSALVRRDRLGCGCRRPPSPQLRNGLMIHEPDRLVARPRACFHDRTRHPLARENAWRPHLTSPPVGSAVEGCTMQRLW